VRVTFFRKEALREARLVLARNPERRAAFTLEARPSARARAVRRGWLGR
jgi:hypothetical protein